MKIVILFLIILNFILPVNALEYENVFDLNANADITIDGDYSDWESLPKSYHFNYDNSKDCWYNGIHAQHEDGQWRSHKCPEGSYCNICRHIIQLYCDGENVYLHIKIANCYPSLFNGDDYNYYINGTETKFLVLDEATKQPFTSLMWSMGPGTYPIIAKHQDQAISSDAVMDSSGFITKHENGLNSELELRISLEEFKKQNENVDFSTISTIEFFTPNLMYKKITLAGSSSGPYVLGIILLTIVSLSYTIWRVKKK